MAFNKFGAPKEGKINKVVDPTTLTKKGEVTGEGVPAPEVKKQTNETEKISQVAEKLKEE